MIGAAWAIVFARAGYTTRLYDVDAAGLDRARNLIGDRLQALAAFDLLTDDPSTIEQHISYQPDLAAAVAGAVYVQECAPEDATIKRQLFASLDRLTAPTAILASSSSAMPISQVAEDLDGRRRCLVAHPGNPPYLLPAVEIVPAAWTSPAAVDGAAELLTAAGMSPIRVDAEVEGFVFNRLQGALLREAYCLVRDGVASVADIDSIVRDSLAMRWSVVGPFEASDLNVRGGTEAHAARMGPAYARMGAERGQHDPWTESLVSLVAAERRALLPLDQWDDRVAWRDAELMALARFRAQRDRQSGK